MRARSTDVAAVASPAADAADAAGPVEAAAPPAVSVRRAHWWSEALVVVGLCWVYDAVNNLARLRRTEALAHADTILRIEQRLHLAPELALNRGLAAQHALGLVLGDYYDLLHFAVTFALLGWLWWRHPSAYRPLRNALVLINVIGFAVFWLYPLAPPRLLQSAGFVDVVAVRHSVGAWSSGTLATKANEFAAMPSLHVAWAVWSTVAIARIARRASVRLLAWLYPAATSVIVLATANHYLLDVVAGVVTAAVALAAASLRRPGAALLSAARPGP